MKISELDLDRQLLDAVSEAMKEPVFSIGYRPYSMEYTVLNEQTGFAVSAHATRGEALAAMQELGGAVSEAMREPEDTAEVQIERRMDFIIRELDQFCGMAQNAETVDLIEKERIAVGQMLVRVQLIAAFLMSRQPSGLRLVSNA